MPQAGPFLPSFRARLALAGLVALCDHSSPDPITPAQQPPSPPHVGVPMAPSAGSEGHHDSLLRGLPSWTVTTRGARTPPDTQSARADWNCLGGEGENVFT